MDSVTMKEIEVAMWHVTSTCKQCSSSFCQEHHELAMRVALDPRRELIANHRRCRMPSNAELMRAADYLLSPPFCETEEALHEHVRRLDASAFILARHVKSTLAPDQGGEITPDKLASLGFRKYGHAFDMTVERNGERQFDLMLAHIGVMWTVYVEANLASVPIVSISEMAELLALLHALGIDTTTTGEG